MRIGAGAGAGACIDGADDVLGVSAAGSKPTSLLLLRSGPVSCS